ncbi:MAG TPA: SpoIID/LytB domain-containing protein [Phycisphaerae bacterium]|nr:SpoIID/LytB domain-containing protein [Phycisphaerae bacterium]
MKTAPTPEIPLLAIAQQRKFQLRLLYATLACACVGALWCCDENPPRNNTSTPTLASAQPLKVPASARAVVIANKPIVMTKPPMLGPLSPPIVILPEKIAEPEIRVRLTDEKVAPPAIVASKYRGKIQTLRLPNGKYVAINVLPLDSYLQGVLTKELLASWDPAAFRAQAIAARTFALFQMVTDGRSKAWDVNADESSQVYGGISAETAPARAAVAATRGQVLMTQFGGKTGIFCSFYSSCIGGASQDPFDAWGDPSVTPLSAHLTGNVDTNSARYAWDRDFVVSKADVTRCVQLWGEKNNFAYLKALGSGGRIESVVISRRNDETRRPVELTLTDSAGRSAPIRAEEFRLALMGDPLGRAPKPYSSNCDIRMQGDSIVLYNGHGYGHGIGMSQWGAQNMARQGYSHTQILTFFYPGSTLKDLW